jgi:Domain of unknown function (DUF4878)/Vanin C-terminal domain
MKRNYFLFLLLLCFFYSCKNKDKAPAGKSENNIDAARNFIRSALDGKFDKARDYMLPDSVNNNYMDVAERSFNNADQSVKDSFRTSTIIIHTVKDVNDSATIVIYSNSFKNNQDTLRVIKLNNQWLVDLKYLYEHDADTISANRIIKDSLK